MDTQPTGAVDPILAADTYGKSRVRLIKLARREGRHDVKEITFQILFRGDFLSCYETGDNSRILPTDTIKNTVYALARQHDIVSIEEFGRRLIEHFLKNNPQVAEVRVEMTEHLWSRIAAAAFSRESQKRTALLTGTRDGVTVEAGIDDLTILKSTGSAFEGSVHHAERDQRSHFRDSGARTLALCFRFDQFQRGVGRDSPDHSRYLRRARQPVGAAHTACNRQAGAERISGCGRDTANHAEQACIAGGSVAVGLDNPNEVFLPIDEPSGYIEGKLVRRGADDRFSPPP
jgi:urate oxidase